MIIVPVKDGENIERALKKFKRKFEKTGVISPHRANDAGCLFPFSKLIAPYHHILPERRFQSI